MAAVLFENGVVGIWGSVTSQAEWLGADGGHSGIRIAAVFAAMIVALVALGPARIKAMWEWLSPKPTPAPGPRHVHSQNARAREWRVVHGLGDMPTVHVYGHDGSEWYGPAAQHPDSNTTVIDFGKEVSGEALLRGDRLVVRLKEDWSEPPPARLPSAQAAFKNLLGHELHVLHELLEGNADMQAALQRGQRITAIIEAGLDTAEAHLFGSNPEDLTPEPEGPNREARHYLRARIDRLADLLQRVDGLHVNEDFRADEWPRQPAPLPVPPAPDLLYRSDPAEIRRLQDRLEAGHHRDWRESIAQRLQEGIDWLQELRRTPDELAAAMEPEVAQWVEATQDTLSTRRELLARFNHAISSVAPVVPDHPRIIREAILGPGPARQRLEGFLVKGTDCLNDFLRENP